MSIDRNYAMYLMARSDTQKAKEAYELAQRVEAAALELLQQELTELRNHNVVLEAPLELVNDKPQGYDPYAKQA